MSEFKYVPKEGDKERVSLDQVTASDEERAQVESQINTAQEDQRVLDANAQRNTDQKALWEKQAKKARSGADEGPSVRSEAYVNQLKENGIDNLQELKLVIEKIETFLLTQSVEWRREYAKEGADLLREANFFNEYKNLSDKEIEIFDMLENDDVVNISVQKTFSSEVEQTNFIKKSIRVARKTEYKMCLTNLRSSVE